jgi:hypothetical protein
MCAEGVMQDSSIACRSVLTEARPAVQVEALGATAVVVQVVLCFALRGSSHGRA